MRAQKRAEKERREELGGSEGKEVARRGEHGAGAVAARKC